MEPSFIQSLRDLAWNGTLFLAYVSIIAYVAAFFGIIRSPRPTGNVVEQTADSWANTGEFLANATDIAKKFNKALSGTAAEPAAAKPQ